MKNILKIKVKISIIMICTLLVSSLNFAAIVSDNDGSAFVTKAEFDALKKSFSEQITNYNTSIDSKIDGAIASYLAGIKISDVPLNIYERINQNAGGTLWWMNSFEGYGTEDMSANLTFSATHHVTIRDLVPYRYSVLINAACKTISSPNDAMRLDQVGMFLGDNLNAGTGINGQKVVWRILENPVDFWSSDEWRCLNLNAVFTTYFPKASFQPGSRAYENFKTVNKNYTAMSDVVSDGSGSRYQYDIDAAGRKYLKYYCSKYYPAVYIECWRHSARNWTDSTKTWVEHHTLETEDEWAQTYTPVGMSVLDTTVQTKDTTGIVKAMGKVTDGTKYGDNDYTHEGYYVSGLVSTIQENSSNRYEGITWGTGIDTTIYANKLDDGIVISGTDTATIPDGEFTDLYFDQGGGNLQKNTISGYNIKYNKFIFPKTSFKIKDFCNYPATQAYGSEVKHGEGVPVFSTSAESVNQRVNIKFKTNNASHDQIEYIVSDDKFTDNAVSTGKKTIASGTATAGTAISFTFSAETKGTYWITFKNKDSGYAAGIESITF